MSGEPVEYIIACIGPNLYTVTKFGGGEAPLDSYQVDMSKKLLECQCMAWYSGKTRPCKHGKMVQQYINAGEPEAGSYRLVGRGKDWVFALNTPGRYKT
jgi:hypothetical protein